MRSERRRGDDDSRSEIENFRKKDDDSRSEIESFRKIYDESRLKRVTPKSDDSLKNERLIIKDHKV